MYAGQRTNLEGVAVMYTQEASYACCVICAGRRSVMGMTSMGLQLQTSGIISAASWRMFAWCVWRGRTASVCTIMLVQQVCQIPSHSCKQKIIAFCPPPTVTRLHRNKRLLPKVAALGCTRFCRCRAAVYGCIIFPVSLRLLSRTLFLLGCATVPISNHCSAAVQTKCPARAQAMPPAMQCRVMSVLLMSVS